MGIFSLDLGLGFEAGAMAATGEEEETSAFLATCITAARSRLLDNGWRFKRIRAIASTVLPRPGNVSNTPQT